MKMDRIKATFTNELISDELSFKTIADAVQHIASADYTGADIFIPSGIHYIENPIVIQPSSLGNKRCSIHFHSDIGNPATLTGACPIRTEWKPFDENIYVADIGEGRKIDALYVNGNRQILARYPNYEPDAVLNGFCADAVSDDRAAKWKNPAGGYIRALHHAEWGSNSYIIDGKGPDGKLQYHWVGDNNRGNKMHAVKRMVENIFEELDSPGEWFYDKANGLLYFWPHNRATLADASIEVVTTETFFKLIGTQDNPVTNVSFENICFSKSHRTLFTGEYERPLRGDWGMVRMGAIFMENTERISIKHCSFCEMGGNAVTISGYNYNNHIDYCDFVDIGATGVLVFGKLSAVRDPSCYDNNVHKTTISDFMPGPKDNNYPREITVSNCYFYNIGVYEKQTAAVCMSISQDITVRRCTIHHTSRAGINIHDGTFGGHLIEGNDLFDTVTETADHGPINCWGRDRYWSVPQHDAMGYYGREKRPFALLDAVKTTTIRGNRVHGNYAFGIDIDDGASNYLIYNNLCIGIGIKLRDGFDRKVYNNMLIGANFEIHMSFAKNNDLLFTNVVVNRNVCNALCINEGATTFFTNNVYWNPGDKVTDLPPDDYNSLEADPMFADFQNNDFTLSQTSPALARGFINFPMKNDDFGRPDMPKPPLYSYVSTPDNSESFQYYDVLLSNITNEGLRSAAGLQDYNGVFIVKRDVLGLFCKLGLPIGTGDVIRSIGDVKISGIDDFIREFEMIPLNVPIQIGFYRSQKPHEITFIRDKEDFRPIAEEAIDAWKTQSPMLYD